MVSTKARIPFLQYLPKKPKKFGVKLWALAEALTGYCLRFQIYTGKCGGKAEHGLSHRVVMDLMEQYYHKNHHVYFDNFHSSPKLLKDLAAKDTFASGTMRIDHGLFSDDFKYSKVAVGDSIFIHEDNIVSVHWKDKRDVFLISSIHNNECVDVPKRKDEIISKPTMIIQYHTYMGRVDKCDQYLSYYSLGPKSIKW